MTEGRFIIIVLDSFGIGAMADVVEVRPQDIGANTCRHLLETPVEKKWGTLEKLGLLNALGHDSGDLKQQETAIFGSSKLKHYGADSYFGHQEISGTDPKKPLFKEIAPFLSKIEDDLRDHGFQVTRHQQNGLELLKVNESICIGDNMETDLGQAINVVGAMDMCGFEMIKEVGQIVRKHVLVPRVIAFGGANVTFERLLDNIITKENRYIGVDAPASGVYDEDYHVVHIGFGVDETKQVPQALAKIGINNHFYGKVADIVYNPNGTNFSAVDTDSIFDEMMTDLGNYQSGFFFLNIQETDLAGHAEDPAKYIERLNVSDRRLAEMLEILNVEDLLLVMADHGNDPTIGHSRHTRENVPLLVYNPQKQSELIDLGNRETMADVGATVAAYFGTEIAFGTSFLEAIQ